MSKGLRIDAFATTDVGRVRDGNEDSYYAGVTVFAVADGMGGHQAGEVASRKALEPIRDLDRRTFATEQDARESLAEAILEANQAVVAEGDADPGLAGMGTTLTAVIVRDGKIHLAHVGDSRAYLLREGDPIRQLTTDHTLVEQLVREGRLSREQAANHPQRSIVTRAIGVDRDVQVDSLPPIELQAGDQVLLCSDGLTGPVEDDDIARLLDPDVEGDLVCERLIDAANAAGGPDNITVVLLRVTGIRARPSPDSDGAHTDALPVPPRKAELGGEAPSTDGPTIGIRTRPEPTSGEDWAEKMGHLGKPQGSEGTGPRMRSERRRGAKVGAISVGVLLLLGLLAGGGYAVLSRAYFVGDLNGEVAIFNGIPQNVAGVPLHWVIERDTGISIDDLPTGRADRIRDGIPAESLVEARAIVERHRAFVTEPNDTQAEPADGDTADDDQDEATSP